MLLLRLLLRLLLLLLLLQGSGLSDGKWVTLGAHEVDDLAVVIDHLRTQGGVSSIGLWGRSMGAVTALLYSARDPDIAGMVRGLRGVCKAWFWPKL
jgi:pimeloyl-ACP methyl ester carboxylesterase